MWLGVGYTLEGFMAVARRDDLVSRKLQPGSQQLQDHWLVIGYEDA